MCPAILFCPCPMPQVPVPMFEGNWESSNLVCVVGEQLPHTVVQNDGWEWVNEGTAVKPKWGYVTWQVGATLVLKVDTRASLKPADQQGTAPGRPTQGSAVKAGGSSDSSPSPAKAGAALTAGKQATAGAGAAAAADPAPVRVGINEDQVVELPPLPNMIV